MKGPPLLAPIDAGSPDSVDAQTTAAYHLHGPLHDPSDHQKDLNGRGGLRRERRYGLGK